MLMAYIYCKKNRFKSEEKQLKQYAEELKEKGEMDQYWLFIYECSGKLSNDKDTDWDALKKNKVSFLKPEYR